ncbi:class I SAM-dependent methyltransferase [Vibrio mediterranei]|uniref:class I SAM-dependent methyltransferase n=1 Tax=Vibrio mediterranei TaxID=689 RepID=UPI0040677D9F
MSKEFYEEKGLDYLQATLKLNMSLQQDEFLAIAKASGARTLLDVGTGSGRDLRYFCENSDLECEGIESVELFAEFASLYSGCRVFHKSLFDYHPKRYDLIWCCASLVHLTPKELLKALELSKSRLNSDGHIYLSLKHGHSFVDGQGRKFYCYTRDQITKVLKMAGFDIQKFYLSYGNGATWINLYAQSL